MRLAADTVEPLPPPLTRDLIAQLGLRGLSCGCGTLLHEGWLNTDVARFATADGASTAPGRIALVNGCHYLEHDATTPFPVDDKTFDWVHSEHFIEHITPAEAIDWLAEMRRLLKPGGYLRLSTPDLRRYAEGYLDEGGTFFAEHRRQLNLMLARLLRTRPRSLRAYLPGEDDIPDRRAFIFNQIFLLPTWGHKWIYDLDELRHAARRAGFSGDAVVERAFGEGTDPVVVALDAPAHLDESLYAEIHSER